MYCACLHEVAQVVRRYWLAGDLTAERAKEAIRDLGELPVRRYGHEALDAPMLTRDAKLAAAPGHTVRIELV